MNQPTFTSGFGDVSLGYRHIEKKASPGPILTVGAAELKWYDLATEEGVPPEIQACGKAHLAEAVKAGSLGFGEAADVGFVILHRCGSDFYFLLPSIWRGSNELWQSVRYRQGVMTDFAAFDPAYPLPGAVRGTFCIWELAIVEFESRAWSEYLRSPRAEPDRSAWRRARFSGLV